MRLYKNTDGQWFGTQADANRGRSKWKEVEVPTIKADLITFLNDYHEQVAEGGTGSTGTCKPYVAPYDPDAPARLDEPPKQGITCSTYKPASDLNAYDVRDVVTACDRKHLGQALGAIISRLHDELEVSS